MAFTRAITVEPGDVFNSRHQRSIARAANDRLRFAQDMLWRWAWAKYNSARLVRNPDASGLNFPAEGEYWKTYVHLKHTSGYDWPLTGPGEPEGANLGSVTPQFIFGNPVTFPEPDRLADLFPVKVNGEPPATPHERWILGALQRGSTTADSSVQYVPAFEAAQTCLAFSFHRLSFHGKSYGGWQATAPQDETHPYCDDYGFPYEYWPNRRYSWTGLAEDVSTAGLHGAIGENDDGLPVVTYGGSCPCDSGYSGSGHVLGVADMPLAWYVAVWDGTTDEGGNCRVNWDRLPKNDWAEGPYDGAPQLRHGDAEQILRGVWTYNSEFRGADSQRDPDTYAIRSIAFDAQQFWTHQYPLAPARGVVVDDMLEAVYPSVEFTADPGAGPHTLQDESGDWAPHDGFVIAGFHAVAVGLQAPVEVRFTAGAVSRTMRLSPDETGAASAAAWLPDGISPDALAVTLLGELELDEGGSLICDAAEIMAYRPQFWDQYLVTRFSTTTGEVDFQGPDYTGAAEIVSGLFEHGCLLGEYPTPQEDSITQNPVFQAKRRRDLWVRFMPRERLLSYSVQDGVAELRFRRELPGVTLSDGDPWDGIAPPPHAIASGELARGETYIVRGTSGAVTYAGEEYGIGQTFTAGTAATYTTTGDAEPWVEDGIRHTAPPKGWTNEWVFMLQTHCAKDLDSSIWKPSIFADFFTFGSPEHFYSPTAGNLRSFINNAYSFSIVDEDTGQAELHPASISATFINPESPSAYTYSWGANNGASEAFRKSRQVYFAPYEVQRCTLEFDEAGQIVVLQLVERLRPHPNAPAEVDPDPDTWSTDEKARLAGTHETEPEDYRTDDNAVREYLRLAYGDGVPCSFKVGDSAVGGYPYPAVDGNCYPLFVFGKLVPECREDGTDELDADDTRVLAETYQQAEEVLAYLCEAFVAGATTTERVCRQVGDAGLYDYTYPALCFEAFGGRAVAPFPDDVRTDRPPGYGPLPNARAYADTHNRLAQAFNLLTRLRLDVPLVWETRVRTYLGERAVEPENPYGSCSGTTLLAWLDGAEAPEATALIMDTDWVEEYSAPVIQGTQSAGLGCCDGTGDWCFVNFRTATEWRISIHPDWLDAVPSHVQALVAVNAIGTVALRQELRQRHARLDEDPRTLCDGTPALYRWEPVIEVDNVETCVLVSPGTVNADLPPTGDVMNFKPSAGSDLCGIGSIHSITWALLAHPGAFVIVPLEDLP